MSRYARRRDLNHTAIAAELEARGYAVSDLGSVGRGVPDLAVSRGGRLMLVEVKRPDRAHLKIATGSAEGDSRARQAAWRAIHPGCVIVATSADEVEQAFSPPPH